MRGHDIMAHAPEMQPGRRAGKERMDGKRNGRRNEAIAFSVIVVMLVLAAAVINMSGVLTGFAVLEEADIMPGKDTYEQGEMAHLFIFPDSADYSIEVYDPRGKLYANSLNFPVERPGIYEVRATLSSGNSTEEVSTTFRVKSAEEDHVSKATPAAGKSTPTNTSAGKADITSTAAGLSESKKKEQKGRGRIFDDGGEIVGKKIRDEGEYETLFTRVSRENGSLMLTFHHNSSFAQPVWIEGDVNHTLSDNTSRPYQNISLVVPLVKGEVPRFRLHIGTESEVFEFGIEVINLKSYPSVGGNWTVEFNTTGTANLTIRGIEGTEFGEDLEFLELSCGDSAVSADYDGSRVFYENYSCDNTGYETSEVMTGGSHALLFEFGDDSAIARNYASSYVCDGCAYTSLTGCLLGVNNT
ncbi:MAG: hypothetical protein R6U32_00765, partial [Candidatus Woesearchaeota archaeon]